MQEKITAEDRDAGDRFGSSIAISGDYAVVGAPLHDYDVFNENQIHDSGAAYIYFRNSNDQWEFVQKITPNERHSYAEFGSSVAIHDEVIVIGAPKESFDGDNMIYQEQAGAAYVFELNLIGKWSQTQKIVSYERDPFDSFANAVEIDATHIIISAETESKDENGLYHVEDAGAVYIYIQNPDEEWFFQQKIVANDREQYDLFGASIAIYQNTLIVGAQFEDHDENGNNYINGAGSVYVFEMNLAGTWFETQKLAAPVRLGKDMFGCALDIHNNKIVIGAKNCAFDENEENEISNAGAAYVFEKSNLGLWNFDQKIVARDRVFNDAYGVSVAISDSYIIVGAENQNQHIEDLFISDAGAAYVYIENNENIWLQSQKIVADPRNEHSYFGHDIALDGLRALFTAHREDYNSSEESPVIDGGALYYFESNPIDFNYINAEICENTSMLLEGEEREEAGSYFDFYEIVGDVYYYNITELAINPLPTPFVENNLGTLSTSSLFNEYQWYLNDIEIAGADEATYTPSVDGNYSVYVIDEKNCEALSSDYYFNDNLSIEDNQNNFLIYPNPATDYLSIENEYWEGQISIFSLNGKEAIHWETSIYGKSTFNLPTLDQGIYVIQFKNTEGHTTRKRLHIIN